jgi:hypothetical protein
MFASRRDACPTEGTRLAKELNNEANNSLEPRNSCGTPCSIIEFGSCLKWAMSFATSSNFGNREELKRRFIDTLKGICVKKNKNRGQNTETT